MSQDPGMTGPHWDFSLAVYSAPGVAGACLDLQDRFAVDVNVLLLALYANACRGVMVDTACIAELDALARPIRELAVVPLRDVRRGMKNRDFGKATETVRGKVKSAELACEQLEQAILAAHVATWPTGDVAPDPEKVLAATLSHFAGPRAAPAAAIKALVSAVDSFRR